MRRPLLAVLGATGLVLTALAAAACSVLAGYEDLRLVPSGPDTGDGGTLLSEGGTSILGDAGSLPPLDPSTAAIYSVYAPIFSPQGNLAGVTAQLARIHAMGFNVLSLMPVTPIGAATGSHPTFGSPYCVHDYYGINASYGSPLDLGALVKGAHALGMYVVLDEEINHTSWDNPLIGQHPEYYVHTNQDVNDPSTIAGALGLADVAQLDYQTSGNGLPPYITTMLAYWLGTYGVDGFRFLTVDVPQGGPKIPQGFWQGLHTSLDAVKPGFVMWGDEEDPVFGGAPFPLDDGWLLRGGRAGETGGAGLQQVANGAAASELQAAWQQQTTGYSGVRHVSFLQTWDFDEDLKVYGGVPNTMAAAAFTFLVDGVPMLWNGEEVGNDRGGADTSNLIDWTTPNASSLTAFYTSLLRLRNGHAALQGGTVTWVTTSAPDEVSAFTRTDASGTFLVAINFASTAVTGTLTAPTANGWTDVSPVGSPGGGAHAPPPALSLAPFDFAVFAAH